MWEVGNTYMWEWEISKQLRNNNLGKYLGIIKRKFREPATAVYSTEVEVT